MVPHCGKKCQLVDWILCKELQHFIWQLLASETKTCPVQALPNWLADMQLTNLDISFCKACNIDVVSKMTSLSVLALQVSIHRQNRLICSTM